jgi:uncharacterized protein
MNKTDTRQDIDWKEWSEQSFEEARKERRLVLLDLTASWCHWCHVMDEKTYSDPDIAHSINQNFVPIRVDIDKRPDISERYNRGGFPTTAFLSDQGESIWGATFVPPTDMKRIMEAILKAKDSGDIDQALERSRMRFLEITKNSQTRAAIDPERLVDFFEDIFSAYDIEHGGFGSEPKFPHPDALDILLLRYVETKGDELADAIVNSLQQMASGLHDKVEGGVFRYSVTRDWKTPHYEKMLETNVGFLRNLVCTTAVIGGHGFDLLAKDIAKYVISNLRDPNGGGFFGSQDADEEYYKLPENARKNRRPPSIDRTVYAGWNADASNAFTVAGVILEDDEMVSVGKASWDYALKHQWNGEIDLVKHLVSEDIYLFEDQVSFLNALLAQIGVSSDEEKIELARRLILAVDRDFTNENGGLNDVAKGGHSIGELDTPRRPLVENSNWALALARFGSLTHSDELIRKARAILDSFTEHEVEAHGVFAAAYLRARWAMDNGLAAVEIHSSARKGAAENMLLKVALSTCNPSIVPFTVADLEHSRPYAIVCTDDGCSSRMTEPEELRSKLDSIVHEKPQE